MSETRLISVIVPVYNTEKYLRKCLDSLVNQTYKNLQIILINDGSTDGSGEICEEYAKKDNRIIYKSVENGGVSSARNKGLALATGDYYHFPDSDDYMELDTYEYLLELINIHNCDSVAFEHFVTFPVEEFAHEMGEERYGFFENSDAQTNIMRGSQFCCNKLYTKEMVKDLFFREDIYRGEDTLFAANALSRANSVWFDKRPLYHYVQSEDSACRGELRPSQFTMLKLYEAYKPLYPEKYPEAAPYFLLFMQENLISLYYDAWIDVDANKYKKERKAIYKTVCSHYKQILSAKIISKKQKLKFLIFKISPVLFCLLHKVIHKL